VLSAAFALAWWIISPAWASPARATDPGRRAVPGVLALTRPLTAVGVALPFGLHGLFLLVRGDWQTRRHVLAWGALAGGVAALTFLWQYAVTRDPF
jgi:hypothetical protein